MHFVGYLYIMEGGTHKNAVAWLSSGQVDELFCYSLNRTPLPFPRTRINNPEADNRTYALARTEGLWW
jgi:hypothetical protein